MSDAYIHIPDVAHIDQPAELEGIRLNWGPSIFRKTRQGPRDLRAAPATPEFWEVWKRNKEALKTAGISCTRGESGDWWVEWWIDVSGDRTDVTPVDGIPEDESYALSSDYLTPVDDIDIPEDESYTRSSDHITPADDIDIPEDESYTLSEVIDLVQRTLDKVKEHAQHNELQYWSKDVYFLLYDMLRYVNQNVSGVFVLRQIQKDTYRVKYMAEDFSKQRSSRKLKEEVNQTARYLEELTGRKRSWGDKE
ncbi:MAG: hypothetical protein OXH39_13485 [Candidatus Poribacteria bacterium]|nr:hypothetical protein [Candidatus Poribacteria bacterium]